MYRPIRDDIVQFNWFLSTYNPSRDIEMKFKQSLLRILLTARQYSTTVDQWKFRLVHYF
jgi:hypothetical protein